MKRLLLVVILVFGMCNLVIATPSYEGGQADAKPTVLYGKASGLIVPIKVDSNGAVYVNYDDDIELGDDIKISFGDSQEASIYWDSNEGAFILSSNTTFETEIWGSGTVQFRDNRKLTFGNDNDSSIYFDGTDMYFYDPTAGWVTLNNLK